MVCPTEFLGPQHLAAGMSLKSFCKLIVADLILTMVVPGLALLPQKLHYLTEVTHHSYAASRIVFKHTQGYITRILMMK